MARSPNRFNITGDVVDSIGVPVLVGDKIAHLRWGSKVGYDAMTTSTITGFTPKGSPQTDMYGAIQGAFIKI